MSCIRSLGASIHIFEVYLAISVAIATIIFVKSLIQKNDTISINPSIHMLTAISETEPKKIECLKSYDCVHIYAETETECQTENMHELDFFRFGRPNFSKYDRFVTSITQHTAHTQAHALYIIK